MQKDRFSIPMLQCKRCGHKWYIRKPQPPRFCPNCKSPYWKTGSEYKQDLDLDIQQAASIEKTLVILVEDLLRNPNRWPEVVEIGWKRMFQTSDFPIKSLKPILDEGFSINSWFINIPRVSLGLVDDILQILQKSGSTTSGMIDEVQKKARDALEWESVSKEFNVEVIKILGFLWFADSLTDELRYPEAEAIIQKKAWWLLERKIGRKEQEAITLIEQTVQRIDENNKGATCWAEVIRFP